MRKLLLMIRVVGIGIALCWGGFARAGSAGRATFSVELFKSRLIVDEPMILKLKLANESSEPLPKVFRDNESFARNALTIVTVRGPDGSVVWERRMRMSHGRFLGGLSKPVLRPGKSLQCEKMFMPRRRGSAGAGAVVRPELALGAGRYKLSAKLWWSAPGGEGAFLSSNVVTFEVDQPRGVDAAAARLLKSEELGGFVAGTFGGKPKQVMRLLGDYPESTYAKYFRARLILDEAGRLRNMRSTPSPSRTKELKALLSDALGYVRSVEDIGLHDNILLEVARLGRPLDEGRSVEIARRVAEQFPESDAAEAARRHLRTWTSTPESMRGQLPLPAVAGEKPPNRVLLLLLLGGVSVLAAAVLLISKKIARPR